MSLRAAFAPPAAVVAAGPHAFAVHMSGAEDSVVRPLELGTAAAVCAVAVGAGVVAVATDDKAVAVFSCADGTRVATHKLVKKATCLAVAQLTLPVVGGGGGAVVAPTPALVVLAGDRNGDVVALSATSSAGNRCILRHTAAIVTDVAVSGGGDAVLSCDREHKIRASSLPFGKPILAYCLGHTAFVRRVLPLRGALAAYAVSGGGDGTVRLWEWRTGTLLATASLVCDAPPATTDSRCVFDLAEDSTAEGRLVACVTELAAVVLLRIRLGDAPAVDVEATVPLPAQPLCAVFCDGVPVAGCADGVFRAVDAGKAPPAWLPAVNVAVGAVKEGVGAQLAEVPLVTFGAEDGYVVGSAGRAE